MSFPIHSWFVTAHVSWVPCLCEVPDINHLWPSLCAVPFSDEKTRPGVHITVQWGCWGSKPEQPGCRAPSLPTTLPCLSPALDGFRFCFQGETEYEALCHLPSLKIPHFWKLQNEPLLLPASLLDEARHSGCCAVPRMYPGHRTPWLSFPGDPLGWECLSWPQHFPKPLCPTSHSSEVAGLEINQVCVGLESELLTITIQNLFFTLRAKISNGTKDLNRWRTYLEEAKVKI